ncbi:MAG: translation initiation factor IF-5A [Thermoproteota archaeon]
MSKIVDLGSVKEGSWIVIDGEPCRIVEIAHSKVGKHGSAKARVVGIGLFDESKHTLMSPVDEKVEVPLIDKRNGQVISVSPSSIVIMDLENYNTFEVPMPKDTSISEKMTPNMVVEYWQVGSRYKVMRIKSSG